MLLDPDEEFETDERGPADGPSTRPARVTAPADVFADLGDGRLVLYRAGAAVAPEHVGLPQVPAVAGKDGSLVPQPAKPRKR